MPSRPFIYITNSYGCNACNGHRDKQQEHPHTQNVTFVTALKETTHLVLLYIAGMYWFTLRDTTGTQED